MSPAGRLIATFATALVVVAGLGYAALADRPRPPAAGGRAAAAVRRGAGARDPLLAPQPDAPSAPDEGRPRLGDHDGRSGRHPGARRTRLRRRAAVRAEGLQGRLDHAGRHRLGRVPARHHRRPDARRRTGTPRRRCSAPRSTARGLRRHPRDPESTAWHGDPTWDHAVGPLQFIPSTWETWGADGDGDGVADPNDLDDAAFAAARYLCADGHDLTTGAGWADAVFGYNHAQSYVDAVYAAAPSYAERTG